MKTTTKSKKVTNTEPVADDAQVSHSSEKGRSRIYFPGKRFRPALLAIVLFAGVGTAILLATRAAGPVNIYIAPPSGTYAVNSTFSSVYRINTNGGAVTNASIRGTYPTDKLECTGITHNATDFSNALDVRCTGGNIVIEVARSISAPNVTGDKAVATLTFKALSAGTAAVTVGSTSQVFGPGSDDGSGDVTNTRTSASYVVANPAPTISSFTATSPVVNGNTTTFNWASANTSGATPCSIVSTGGVSGHSYTNLVASGSRTSNALANSTTADINATFRLTCNGGSGTTAATSNVTVVVKPTPPPGSPTITSFTATTPVTTGNTTTFNWATTNTSGATPCSIISISGVSGHSYTGLGASSSKVSTALTNSTTADISAKFRLTCSGASGTAPAVSEITVIIKPAGTVTPPPPPPPSTNPNPNPPNPSTPQPTSLGIQSFTAQVTDGTTLTATWQTNKAASSLLRFGLSDSTLEYSAMTEGNATDHTVTADMSAFSAGNLVYVQAQSMTPEGDMAESDIMQVQIPVSSEGQTAPSLVVTVKDGKKVVRDALVKFSQGEQEITTDGNGIARFNVVADSTEETVTVEHDGKTTTKNVGVTLTGGQQQLEIQIGGGSAAKTLLSGLAIIAGLGAIGFAAWWFIIKPKGKGGFGGGLMASENPETVKPEVVVGGEELASDAGSEETLDDDMSDEETDTLADSGSGEAEGETIEEMEGRVADNKNRSGSSKNSDV